jgi:2Fe-2S ferredoxin
MARVTYISSRGAERVVDVANGESAMRGAVDNSIEGIVGECGGALACATCHCYVDDAWIDKLNLPGQAEHDMLEYTSSEHRPSSRLSCQIILGDSLDGLVVHLPETQY